MAEFWSTVIQQARGGSRSDVLRALIWPNALILAALLYGAAKGVPQFILILLSFLLVIFMALYGASYVIFGMKDPNLLRSEKYNIDKMAIEHGMFGDSLTGLRDLSDRRSKPKVIDVTPLDDGND